MTAAEHEALQNHYERAIERAIAERMALLKSIVDLAQSVVEAIPPLPKD
jgi:hypothetical protein